MQDIIAVKNQKIATDSFDLSTFELWAQHASTAPRRFMPGEGLEPSTTSLKGLRSTDWANQA